MLPLDADTVPAAQPTFEHELLDELDIGLVVVSPRLDRVLVANRAGRTALALIGDRVPGYLADWLLRTDAAHRGRGFTQPTPVEGFVGADTLFMRVKRLPGGELLAMTSPRPRRDDDLAVQLRGQYRLTHRECQVALLARRGLRNKEIAEQLGLSLSTIKGYLSAAFFALNVRSRAELIVALEQLG